MISLPKPPDGGNPPRDWYTRLLRYLQAITPRSSSSIGVNTGSGGTTFHTTNAGGGGGGMRLIYSGVLPENGVWTQQTGSEPYLLSIVGLNYVLIFWSGATTGLTAPAEVIFWGGGACASGFRGTTFYGNNKVDVDVAHSQEPRGTDVADGSIGDHLHLISGTFLTAELNYVFPITGVDAMPVGYCRSDIDAIPEVPPNESPDLSAGCIELFHADTDGVKFARASWSAPNPNNMGDTNGGHVAYFLTPNINPQEGSKITRIGLADCYNNTEWLAGSKFTVWGM